MASRLGMDFPRQDFKEVLTMKKVIALSFTLLMAAGVLAGCNTIEGAGKDVERGGQAVQDAAD